MKSKLMAKLALAVAVVCAAVGNAHATYIQFKAEDIQAAPSDTSVGSYLWYAFATADTMGQFTDKLTTTEEILSLLAGESSATGKTLDNLYVKSGRVSTAGKIYDSTTKFDLTTTASATFLTLLIDTDSFATANNYLVLKTSSGGTELAKTIEESTNEALFDWGSQKNNSWASISTIVVPEPTSGVLLLVGVAALALRRKTAA